MKHIVHIIYHKILSILSLYHEYSKRERTFSWGQKNSDKTFYIICFDYDTQGLFAIVKSVLSHVMYAVDKGWIPIVDLQNYACQYKKDRKNAWEMFFEQPCGYTLNDIKDAKNVIRSYYGMYPYGKYAFYEEILFDKDKLTPIADAYKKYIRPQAHIKDAMLQTIKDLNIDNKTLGVLCRGTDYINRKPHNHPRQPEPEQVIADAREYMDSNNYTSIFVATEDDTVLEMFKQEFGDQLLYINQPRIKLAKEQTYLSEVAIAASVKYKMAIDYYTALYILSKCTAIIAGSTAGTMGTVLMSEGFKYSYFYNLGHYE